MSRRRRIYEGKAKTLFEGPEPGTIVQHFKDDATAFNNQKKGTITGKGVINNRISEFLMTKLGEIGVPTHFIRRLNMREQLIRQVEIIPLEIVVRNVAAGSFAKRFGIEEGTQLPRSIMEFFYKNDTLGDPMVTEEHITAFGWATPQDLDDIVALTLRVNDFLFGLFLGCGIKLIDFKIEFGRLYEDDMVRIVLADEISPDSCRLWDLRTNEKLDKDRFRRDLGKVEEAYQEVARRLGILIDQGPGEQVINARPNDDGRQQPAGCENPQAEQHGPQAGQQPQTVRVVDQHAALGREQFRSSGGAGSNDGQSGGRRLQQHQRAGLVAGGKDEQVDGLHETRDIATEAEKPDPSLQPEVRGEPRVGTAAPVADHYQARIPDVHQRPQQRVEVLAGRPDIADEQQQLVGLEPKDVAGSVAGLELVGVHAIRDHGEPRRRNPGFHQLAPDLLGHRNHQAGPAVRPVFEPGPAVAVK